MINGLESTDKRFTANSFCEYFTNIARHLKTKSFLLHHSIRGKPAGENLPNQVTESQFTFRTVKESEIFQELKNLRRHYLRMLLMF